MNDRTPISLDEIARLSARLGSDLTLVQGAGGNTSLKADGQLWVKASGTWLAQALDRPIFLPVPLDSLRRRVDELGDEALAEFESPEGLRPSIETPLHAAMPHRVVLHVHSISAIVRAVRVGDEERMARHLLGLRWAWVPYRRPGWQLTRAVVGVIATASSTLDVLVLANHGLVLGAASCEAAAALLDDVEARLATRERPAAVVETGKLLAWLDDDPDWGLPVDPSLHAIATDEQAMSIVRAGALYPDHVVFLGPTLPLFRSDEPPSTQALRLFHRTGVSPSWAIVAGLGIILRRDITPGAVAMLQSLSMVARRLDSDEGLAPLSTDDVQSLVHWDSEKYRQGSIQPRTD